MISLIAAVVSKIVTTVQKVTDTKLTADYVSRTVISEAIQTSKLKLEVVIGEFYKLLKKYLSNTVSLSDKLTTVFGKKSVDVVRIYDETEKGVQKTPTPEMLGITDAAEKTSNYKRDYADNLNLEDTSVNSLAKIQIHTVNLTDQFSKTVIYNKSITDQIFGTDDLNGSAVDDDQIISFFKIPDSEIIQITESLIISSDFLRGFSNSGEVSERFDIKLLKNIVENIELEDQISKTIQYTRIFDNTGDVTDFYQYSFEKAPILENLNIGDQQKITYNKYYSDLINLTETSLFDVGKSLTDITSVNDNKNIVLLKTLPTLSVQITDSILIGFDFYQEYFDSNTVSDLPKIVFEKVPINSINIDDSLYRTVEFNRDIDNITNLSDLLQNSVNKTVTLQQVEISDSASILFTYGRVFIDISELTDTVQQSIEKLPPQEVLQLIDSISRIVNFNKSFDNTTNITDQSKYQFNKNIFEQDVELQEIIFIGSGLFKSDTTELKDTLNYGLNKVPTEEQIQILSLAKKSTDKNNSDSIQISTSGILLNQSYVGTADYFKEDYVGASRLFT